jgi:hypothetical protein
MPLLTNPDIVRLWEDGLGQDAIARALTILAAADPAASPKTLACLPIGQRDARLLTVREQIFGPRLESVGDCPVCGGVVELTLDASELRSVCDREAGNGAAHQAAIAGCEIAFRLPVSHDLTAIQDCGDVAVARLMLAERCIVHARRDGAAVRPGDLPDPVLDELAARMAVLDPGAEIDLSLLCPYCGHRWQVLFEIGTFLWTELAAQAKRLLREIAALARVFGWSEAEVLALSATRRQIYLELAGGG